MVTLMSCLISQIICFILQPNEYGCLYDWTTLGIGPAIDLQKMPIMAKKIIFSDEAHFDLGGSLKLSHLGHRKPARIHWKADALKTSHCLVRILVIRERHNWAIFLRKWARRGRYSQWQSLSGRDERIFFLFTALRAIQPKLHSIFCTLFALSAAELMTFGHLRAAIWHRWTVICRVPSQDKRYADMPETIDALKDNIR